MWLIAIPFLAVAAFAAVALGFVPPLNASTLMQVRNGGIRVTRGRIQPHAREYVTQILTEAGVSRGFIAITAGNRVKFSRQIPAEIRQRLRNVLLNQWM